MHQAMWYELRGREYMRGWIEDAAMGDYRTWANQQELYAVGPLPLDNCMLLTLVASSTTTIS